MRKIRHIINRVKEGRIKEILLHFGWIFQFAKPHMVLIVAYTLLGFSGTIVSLISSLISRDLVDIITGRKTGELIFTFCSMMVITLVSTFIGQISSLTSTKITIKIDNYIKGKIFDEIMSSEWEELAQYHSGDLIVRWSSDTAVISSGILNLVPNLIIALFQFASALYMVCKYDASFAVFALLGAPISLLISRESIRRMRKNNMGTMAVSTKMSSFNQEAFGNIQLLKAFDMIPYYSKQLRELQKEYSNVQMKYQKAAIANTMFLTVLSMIVTNSAQGWGIYKVWTDQITYGTMTMFLTLSSSLNGTVNRILTVIPNAIQTANSASRLMSLTDIPQEDYSQRDLVAEFYENHKEDGVGMHIRSVTYAYRGGENVLEEVDFDAFPREVVALVGPSGEGKTTMLRYLLAIVKSEMGRGYISAGKDGDRIDLSASIRQLIAYVPQGNTMFSGTIAENMRKVKEDATDEEIVEALKMACAWKFVDKLPDGIYAEIKERGGGLSEGQAQRLSIARALLRKSPILMLDEATSALDIDTEREVLKNIMLDSHARTCIVTTHRPTVLNICNRVYSISDKKCFALSQEEIAQLIHDF